MLVFELAAIESFKCKILGRGVKSILEDQIGKIRKIGVCLILELDFLKLVNIWIANVSRNCYYELCCHVYVITLYQEENYSYSFFSFFNDVGNCLIVP